MKKLFVSVPMKGRETKDIKRSIEKMKNIAELYEEEELELIDSYIENNPPKNIHEAIWHLGESIKKLSEADIFIGIDDDYMWAGCSIERDIARRYGIKNYDVPAGAVIDDYNELAIKVRQEVYPVQ